MSTNALTTNTVTCDTISPRTSSSSTLSVTTTGNITLATNRINFNNSTAGNITHDGSTFYIDAFGQRVLYGTGSTQRIGIRTTSPSYTLDVNGGLQAQERLNLFVTTQAAVATTTTTNFVTMPSAGVYLLMVSQCSGTTSQTPELIDNLTRLALVVCSTASNQTCQIYNLGNNTGFFSLSGNGQFGINLTVNSGTFAYRAFYQKIF